MNDPLVEAVAIALYSWRMVKRGLGPMTSLDYLIPSGAKLYRAEANAAIHAYTEALSANGFIVIPPASGVINDRDRKPSSG